MLSFLLTFAINMIDGCSILLLFLFFMAKEVTWNRKRLLTIVGIFTVIMGIGSALQDIRIVNVAMIGLPVAVNLFCTRKRLYNFWMILTAFMFYILWYICFEYIVELIFLLSEQEHTLGSAVGMLVLDGILLGVLIGIIVYSRKQKVDIRLSGLELVGYYAYFIFFLLEIFLVYMMIPGLSQAIRVSIGVLLVLFMLAIYVVYTGYLFTRRKKRQMEDHVREIDKYLDMQMTFLERDKEDQQQMRQLRHDLRNHLQVIKELCADNSYKEAEKYVDSLYQKADMTKVMHMTGNQVADIVLSAKKEEAVRRGLAFQCEGEFQRLEKIEPVDVCAVFSNVLDNALEAAEKAEAGKITVRGIAHKNYYTLIVTNSVAEPVKIKNNRIMTTKKDKKHHGIGLESVQKTALKYQGECLVSCEGQEFTTKIILLV